MNKTDKGIRLSPKYGVNPMVTLCFYCQESMDVALLGRLKDDAEAPRQAVIDMEPYDKCAGYMEQGVILISVRDGDDETDNPYRTGGWVVVIDEVIHRMIDEQVAEEIVKRRMAFVPDDAWDKIGLPR